MQINMDKARLAAFMCVDNVFYRVTCTINEDAEKEIHLLNEESGEETLLTPADHCHELAYFKLVEL